MKKIITIIGVMLVILSSNLIYAEDELVEVFEGDYELRYVSLVMVASNLNLTTTDAFVNCDVQGRSGDIDNIVLTVKLKKFVNGTWITEKTWHNNFNSYRVSFKESIKVTSGHQYKVVSDVYVYNKGQYVEYTRSESRVVSN